MRRSQFSSSRDAAAVPARVSVGMVSLLFVELGVGTIHCDHIRHMTIFLEASIYITMELCDTEGNCLAHKKEC